MTYRPTKDFFESMIRACQAEKEKHRAAFDWPNFERQTAVERFCEYLIKNGIFVEEGAKGEKDGADGMVNKETTGRQE